MKYSILLFILYRINLPMKEINRKTNLQVISLCIGFLGIQIGFALQAGNATRIFQNYGADLNQISLFWLIAPLTGMIVQPIIGHISDRWIKHGGTRVPFLLAGGIVSTIALFAIPNADLFISFIPPLLFGGIFFLLTDTAFNISIHPLRAAIADYLPQHQQSQGFTTQTFLISIGAIIGSGLPYCLHVLFDTESTAATHQIASNVKWSFYIGGLTLLLCIIITSISIIRVKPLSLHTAENSPIASKTRLSFRMIPHVMWKIGIIQFFSWSAFFLIWVYMTPAIAQHFYDEYNHLPTSSNYAKAADYTGILFAIYHISASICSLLLPFVFRRLSLISSHSIALCCGGIGLLLIYLSNDTSYLLIAMALIGIAWASILATPFILLSNYIAKEKIGLYLGLFNLFITLPQILNGLFSGYIIDKIFDSSAIYAIVLASISLFIAAIISIVFKKSLTQRRLPDN